MYFDFLLFLCGIQTIAIMKLLSHSCLAHWCFIFLGILNTKVQDNRIFKIFMFVITVGHCHRNNIIGTL